MPVMTKGRKGPGSRIQVPEMKKTELRKPSAENPLAEWSAPEQQVATLLFTFVSFAASLASTYSSVSVCAFRSIAFW